jgi:MFS family permease
LSLLVWVYFLQIYDKTIFGYGNSFGLSADLHLVNQQYSLASSMTSIATLAWQPFSAFIIVRFNPRYLMTIFVFCWGTSAACMAASNGVASLLATRFLLGLFEAANIPLFSMLTASWYRRAEQPLRVCAWFITNSAATIVAALVSYGL